MKIITAIDIMDGDVVRLVKGKPENKTIYDTNPVETAKKWEQKGADMLHVVDLDAALRTGKNNTKKILEIIDTVKIPVQVAGGIRSVEAANKLLNKKASKVVIGTMAYKDPQSIRHIARKKASKIVIAIDQINSTVMIDGWRESSDTRLSDAINTFYEMGIREFLLTTVERDGTLQGPDVQTLSSVASLFPDLKIIASGGISSIIDIVKVRSAGCSSVVLGKALYDGKIDIEKSKAIS